MPRQKFPPYSKAEGFNQQIHNNLAISLQVDFPHLNAHRFRALGPETRDLGYRVLEDGQTESLSPKVQITTAKSLCAQYGCDSVQEFYAFIGPSENWVRVKQGACQLMKASGQERLTLNINTLTYNCIGWALGIRDWVNPPLDKFRGDYPIIVSKLIAKVAIQYPPDHEKNVGNFVGSLKLVECATQNFAAPQDGAVAFFFNQNTLTHGSRFAENIDNERVAGWTSKLGSNLLAAHDLADLSDNSANATYGMPLCYAHSSPSHPIDKL